MFKNIAICHLLGFYTLNLSCLEISNNLNIFDEDYEKELMKLTKI